jgi:hypothetical protein
MGLAVVAATHADTASTSAEAELGTVALPARTVDDTQASAQKAVRFEAGGGGSSDAKPNADNTGVPGGVILDVVTGDQMYSLLTPMTIANKEFRGFVTVTGGNITFVNCFFRGGVATHNSALLDTSESKATVEVRDSEFSPMSPSKYTDGLWTANTTLTRVNVHGGVDGMKAASNTLVQNSYIHDTSWYPDDPNVGGPTHNDGVQTLEGSNIVLRANNIDMSTSKDPNAAWQITQDFGLVSDIHAESNWVDGGACTINVSHKQYADLSHPLTGVYLVNNRFGRHRAYLTCAILRSTKTTLTQNSGNVYDDNNAPIPAPDVHD